MAYRSIVKDPRVTRSDAALRDALLRLLDRKALDEITARDISAEAGVHYATFFRHYESKQRLLEVLATEQIARLVELTLPIAAAQDHAAAFAALCAYVEEHRALWSVLLNGGAGLAMRAEWLRLARSVAATVAPVPGWLSRDLIVTRATSLIADTVAWWLAQPEQAYSAEHMSRILSRLSAPIFDVARADR